MKIKRGRVFGVLLVLMLCLSYTYAQNSSEFEPSIVMGTLVDFQGNPLGGEEIVLQWEDVKGKTHLERAKTLSWEEAVALGNERLVGSFSFNDEDIQAAPGTTMFLKTQPRYMQLTLNTHPSAVQNLGNIKIGQGQNIVMELPVSSKWDSSLGFLKKWLMVILLVAGVVLFSLLGHRAHAYWKRKKTISDLIYKRDMESFYTLKVEDVMKRSVVSVSPESTIIEALDLMMQYRINGVVVTEGKKIVGMLTETDFVQNVYGKSDNASKKVKDVMTSKVTSALNSTLLVNALDLMVQKKIRKLPIIQNDELVGIITFTDAIRMIHLFFLHHSDEKEAEELKQISDVMDRGTCVVRNDMKVIDLVEYMRENTLGAVLVSADPQLNPQTCATSIKEEQDLGIITTKDLLEEFYKNPNSFENLRAATIKHSPLITIAQHKNVADAASLMAECTVRRLPVSYSGKIVGIISQQNLIRPLLMYFKQRKK